MLRNLAANKASDDSQPRRIITRHLFDYLEYAHEIELSKVTLSGSFIEDIGFG
jgi:hypothetical protein